MKIDTYVCEGCGNKTEDVYTKGWIQIEGSISRSHGRNENRSAVADFISAPPIPISNPHTFCNLACLGRKLDEIATERARKEESQAKPRRARCDCGM